MDPTQITLTQAIVESVCGKGIRGNFGSGKVFKQTKILPKAWRMCILGCGVG